jgi:hypothetical protein
VFALPCVIVFLQVLRLSLIFLSSQNYPAMTVRPSAGLSILL